MGSALAGWPLFRAILHAMNNPNESRPDRQLLHRDEDWLIRDWRKLSPTQQKMVLAGRSDPKAWLAEIERTAVGPRVVR